MISQKLKICSICGNPSKLWRSSPPTCKTCASKQSKPIKQISDKKKAEGKVTGELALFKAIWATRPHVCEVTGEQLKEFDVWNFAHILSKKAFPKFRLFDKNIVLMSRDAHSEYDCGDRSLPMFNEIRKLHDELILLYYKK